MQTNRFMALTGSVALALILAALVLQMPARAAEREPLLAQENGLTNLHLNSATTAAQSAITSSTLSCREGLVGQEPYLSAEIDVQSLGGGIYLDFSAHAPAPQPDAMEFIQVLRVRQNKDSHGNYLASYTVTPTLSDAAGGLGPMIASAPGSLWLVGNEPDRGPNLNGRGAQDDTYPGVYARAYHDVYDFIKRRDPTALMANAGLVEITPGRLQYLTSCGIPMRRSTANPCPSMCGMLISIFCPKQMGLRTWQ